jgi:hypothetical protein
MTDHLVYIDGRLVSVKQLRAQEKIERALKQFEFDLLLLEMELEQRQEAVDEARWLRRMNELQQRRAGISGLIYKVTVTDNARRR